MRHVWCVTEKLGALLPLIKKREPACAIQTDMNGWFTYNGPTAGQWGDPKVQIPGYPVVDNPQPGDVIAIPHRYGDATGHVGIVVVKGKTASQSSITDSVEVNDWGFRPGQKPVFRRCTCPAK